MKESVTISVTLTDLEKIKEHYSDYLLDNNGEYVYFCAKKDDVIITGFNGNKEKKKVTFIGEDALKEAHIWDETAIVNVAKEVIKEEWLCLDDQIGSDEVGVADFFLPMIVVAAYVNKEDILTLKKLGVHDSKKLTDQKIMKIGPELVKRFHYSKLTLPNEKYNEMVSKEENLNSLKAKMHNRALSNLHDDYPEVVNIFVDEFVNEDKYYEYLNDENEKQLRGITFKTKGESRYPSVALASTIARYAFLLEKEKLEEKYQMKFPFGASKNVDEFAKEFLKKFGLAELDKLVKKNFKNYKYLLEESLL